MAQESPRAQATIDREALRANYAELLRHAGGRTPIAVVKADAYGHGAVPVARALVEAGCRRLAVVTVEETCTLRDAGLEVPILVLGGAQSEREAEELAARGATPVVHDRRDLAWLESAATRAGRPLDVQVEVDTGMSRMGASCEGAVDLLARVGEAPSLSLAGTFTHLARADEEDLQPSLEQLSRFREVLREARRAGVAPGEVHVANSAAILAGEALRGALPESAAVRPGLMLYGALPAAHFAAKLAPVMTLATRVQLLRDLSKGEAVGYGATFRAERDTRVATLPLGYADGVPISTSNRGAVRIGRRRHPIVGRVSMDSIVVEVGDAPVSPGDEAVLFGRGGPSVEEAAEAAGTLSYELLVRVGARVERRYTG